MVRYVSTAAFAVALLGFLLPFGTVGCDGEQVEVTGVELATYRVPGAERDRSGEPNLAQEMEDDGGWVALLALVAAAVGLALAAAARGWWGLVSLVGLAAVLALPLIAAGELADVWIHVGFVLAVVGFSVAGCTRASTGRSGDATPASTGGRTGSPRPRSCSRVPSSRLAGWRRARPREAAALAREQSSGRRLERRGDDGSRPQVEPLRRRGR